MFLFYFLLLTKKKNNKKRTLINIYMYTGLRHSHFMHFAKNRYIIETYVSIIKKKLLYTTAVQTRFITTIKMKDNY